jgi:hypothetical protein
MITYVDTRLDELITYRQPEKRDRILAIDPVGPGFGYVVFEGEHLIEWGVAHTLCSDNRSILRRLERMMERYQISVLVVEDVDNQGSRRRQRVRELLPAAVSLARRKGIRPRKVPWEAVRKAFSFSGKVTKYEIATVIACRYPELGLRLPPERKLWMSEDRRMSIFDAAALALTYFGRIRDRIR